jgi:hypothetical protein
MAAGHRRTQGRTEAFSKVCPYLDFLFSKQQNRKKIRWFANLYVNLVKNSEVFQILLSPYFFPHPFCQFFQFALIGFSNFSAESLLIVLQSVSMNTKDTYAGTALGVWCGVSKGVKDGHSGWSTHKTA